VPTIVIKLLAAGAGAAAAVGARRAVEFGWRRVRGQEPPTAGDGVASSTELRDKMAWAALLAVSVLVAQRVVSSRTERMLDPDPA
jgi:hypothetical protein